MANKSSYVNHIFSILRQLLGSPMDDVIASMLIDFSCFSKLDISLFTSLKNFLKSRFGRRSFSEITIAKKSSFP